jgi:hypothetical protein
MLQRIASVLLLALGCSCAQTPMNVSASTLTLEPGTFAEAEIRPTAGADLLLRLVGQGPGDATFELALATGQVFAEGNLKLSHLERSYSSEEIPLRLTLEAFGDEPVSVDWELRSAAPLDAVWTTPAPRDG